MVVSCLDVVHDTLVGSQNDVSELSGWEDLVNELLEILQLQIESWWDDTGLVESSVQVNNDLSGSLVVNNFEVVDVTMSLHNSKELDNDLGDWSEEDLYLLSEWWVSFL